MKMGKRMRFGLRWLALCSMVVLFAGCSQQSQHGAKASKAAKIVLYSNSLSSGRGAWLKKEAANAGFNITPVSLGGGDVINRLVSEKNKPVADVVYGSSQFGFTNYSKKSGKVMTEFFVFNMKFNRKLSYYSDFAFKNINLNKILRLYDANGSFVDHAADEITSGIKEDTRIQLKSSSLRRRSEMVTYLIVGLLYFLIGLKAIAGETEIGTAVACVGTLQMLIYSLGEFFSAMGSREASLTTMHQYQEFMAYEAEELEKDTHENTPDFHAETAVIEFRHVSYTYPSQDKPAIDDVSFSINPGEKLAVVGPNGSGKSTMIKLLTRLIKPTSGEILIDGRNIQDFSLDEYRRIFSVVSQNFFLVADTVARNISIGNSENEQQINMALDKARMLDRVASLKDGVETPITKQLNPEGVDFSGREAQKLAIARAVFSNAPIFILDEPTAALDPMAEADIFDRFLEITEQHTTIFISHRMSSTRASDRIIVFNDGKVVEVGTHDELMAEKGLYQQLYEAQAEFFENDARVV